MSPPAIRSSCARRRRPSGAAATPAALLRRARAAARRAYCPYSGYAVGAALLARDGRVFGGCNVENASYGLTICAERNALAAAVAAGCRAFAALAVAGGRGRAPALPCGACLQALAEFCPPDFPIHTAPLRGRGGHTFALRELLPRRFQLPENPA